MISQDWCYNKRVSAGAATVSQVVNWNKEAYEQAKQFDISKKAIAAFQAVNHSGTQTMLERDMIKMEPDGKALFRWYDNKYDCQHEQIEVAKAHQPLDDISPISAEPSEQMNSGRGLSRCD